MARFDQKSVLVTGGTTGIGFAVAQRLVAEGAHVVITGTDQGRIDMALAKLGDAARGVRCDQSNLDDIDALPAMFAGAKEPVDGVVLNAGVTMPSSTEVQTPDHFAQQLMINLRGPYFIMQKFLPLLRPKASVVAVTSCLHQLGMPGMGVYAASKAALRSLVRTWAAEFKEMGVRVNAVAPGPIQTPIYGKLGLPESDLQDMAADIISRVPMGRFGDAEEVARAIAFLLSEDASYMTGTELTIDGGWTEL